MIDPKQKAEELVEMFRLNVLDYEGCSINEHKAKQCAKIHVKGILDASPSLPILGYSGTFGEDIELSKTYWQEVLNELNKM